MPVLPDPLLARLSDSSSCRRVAGEVAHRLNNTLFPLLGQLDLLRSHVGADAAPILDAINHGARRAATLSRSLLIISGGLPPALQPVDLNGLLQEISLLFHSRLPRNVRLAQSPAPHLPLIQADPRQLEEAILHLLINAQEAIGARPGLLSLHTRDHPHGIGPLPPEATILCPLPGGPCVTLSIRDTGSGIPPEIRPLISAPFFSTRDSERGLGLPMVIGTLLIHRAGLYLESTPAHGAAFTLCLPLPDPATEPTDPCWPERPANNAGANNAGANNAGATNVNNANAAGAADTAAPQRVLVIEDDDDLRALCCQVLSLSGMEAIGATDGVDALQLSDPSWDLVLLDLSLPRMSGRKTLLALRQAGVACPVILCSGHDEDRAMQIIGLPVEGYLPKPWRITDLQRRVTEVLERAQREI